MKRNYFWQFIISIDQFFNALFAGWADETISSRAYRSRVNGSKKWAFFESCINILFFFDYEKEVKEEVINGVIEYKNIKIKHCQLSYFHEKERGHLAPEFRTHQ